MAVQNGDDHRADAHLAARGAIVTVEHPEIGPERHSGNPIRLSRTPLVPPAAAPRLGADTEDVLIRVLGLSRAERSEEHTSELQSLAYLVCRLLLEKKKNI